MSERDHWGRPTWKAAQAKRNAVTAGIGTELMNAFNRDKTDPSGKAELGHETSTGFEFNIERDGVVYTITITRDWDT